MVEFPRAFDDTTHVLAFQGVFEFPVGVSCEILADYVAFAPGETEHFPADPEVAEAGHCGCRCDECFLGLI